MSTYKDEIRTSDITSYVRLKGIDNYTYWDMVATLNSESYDNIPDTFLLFMGRAIEDTIIRLYPNINREGYMEDGDMYRIPEEISHVLHVGYHIEGKLNVVGYNIREIVKGFNLGKLDKFLDVYMKRVVTKLADITDNAVKDGDIREGVLAVESLFETVAKVNVYISKEGKEYRITMKSQIKDFIRMYNKEVKKRKIQSNIKDKVQQWLLDNYLGYDTM